MAPFRSSARTNRSGRLQAENDIMEGLPIRQWRQVDGTFGLPPPVAVAEDKDLVFPELAMPRDAQMLAPHVQALLREARKPRFARRVGEVHSSDTELKRDDDEGQGLQPKAAAAKAAETSGWTARKWTLLAKNMEEPEVEYLAKRRKGLPTYTGAPASLLPQIVTRTAKVRKVDAGGVVTVYEVIVSEGQVVEGEVKDEDVAMVDAPVLPPGTVIEGVGVANAEGQIVAHDLIQHNAQMSKRRPPPPKRKGGPGRGKKKIFQAPTEAQRMASQTTALDVLDPNGAAAATAEGTDGAAVDGEEDGDDDGEEDGEDGEEGEEGEEVEDGGEICDNREEAELPNSARGEPDMPTIPATVPTPEATDETMADAPAQSADVIAVPETTSAATNEAPLAPAPTPTVPAGSTSDSANVETVTESAAIETVAIAPPPTETTEQPIAQPSIDVDAAKQTIAAGGMDDQREAPTSTSATLAVETEVGPPQGAEETSVAQTLPTPPTDGVSEGT